MPERPPVHPSPGDLRELGQLIAAFDQSTAKLKASHDALQARVAELTGELSEKNRALSASLAEVSALKNTLEDILGSITDGVVAIDLERRAVAVNAAAAEVLPALPREAGLRLEETLGQACPPLAQLLLDALDGRSVTSAEVIIDAAPGEARYLAVSSGPIRREDGTLLGAVQTFRDLTPLRALQERAARQDRLAALGEMAAGVAHEIRNPLGGIELYAGAIKRNLHDPQKAAHLADKISAAAGSLNRIVTDMLTFTGSRPAVRRPTPLAAPISAAFDLAAAALEQKTVRVVRDPAAEERVLALDRDLLPRAFLNVILNAAQVMDPGGELTVDVVAEPGAVEVRFLDTGPGIPPEALEKLFHPFFTLRRDGTGLGLAIAHKIAQDHGATLIAANRPEGGAAFAFRFRDSTGVA